MARVFARVKSCAQASGSYYDGAGDAPSLILDGKASAVHAGGVHRLREVDVDVAGNDHTGGALRGTNRRYSRAGCVRGRCQVVKLPVKLSLPLAGSPSWSRGLPLGSVTPLVSVTV